MAVLGHVPTPEAVTETVRPGLSEGPTCTTGEPWFPEGRRQGPGPGRRGEMPRGSISSLLSWCFRPSLEAFAFSRVLGPRGTLLSPGLPAVPSGFSTSYLQSLAHILLPQEAFPDCSGPFRGSNNSTSMYVRCCPQWTCLKQHNLPGI